MSLTGSYPLLRSSSHTLRRVFLKTNLKKAKFGLLFCCRCFTPFPGQVVERFGNELTFYRGSPTEKASASLPFVRGWTGRGAGRACKLKADERSECSLKETAAVPPSSHPSFPLTAELTRTGSTVNPACPESPSSSLLLVNAAVSLCAQAVMKLSATSHANHWAAFIQQTHTVSRLGGKKPHWQVWTQTHTELIYACGEAVDEWTFSLFLIHCHFLVPLVCGCDCCYRVDLISLSHDRHEAQHTLRHAVLCSASPFCTQTHKHTQKEMRLQAGCVCARLCLFPDENIKHLDIEYSPYMSISAQ